MPSFIRNRDDSGHAAESLCARPKGACMTFKESEARMFFSEEKNQKTFTF
jgi:hypothetical protein